MLGTSDDGPARAQEFFRRAIEREPRLAIAYAGLGDSYVDQSWLNSKGRDQTVPQAKAALKKAIELDPRLSEAHVLEAQIAQDFDWDWTAAEAAYRKAIELNPGSDLAHREYSSYLLIVGRPDDAIAEARVAQSLDPLSVYATHQLGFNFMASGRLPEAAAQFRAAIDLNPTWVWGNIKLGLTYALMGDKAKALAAEARADELLGTKTGSPLAQSWLATTAYLCGDPKRLERTLARLQDEARTSFVDPLVLASLYYAKGDTDRMFESLEQGYALRSPLMTHLGVEGRFLWKDVARDPRYLSLVKRMAYPPAATSR
jgi:tetratricopeptide (TPR) repeat protein